MPLYHSESAGAIPTFPGTERLPSRGVVIPTTPTFSPEGVVITTLFVILFGIVLASCPGLNNEGGEVAVSTEV